jgi:hypothetical protein
VACRQKIAATLIIDGRVKLQPLNVSRNSEQYLESAKLRRYKFYPWIVEHNPGNRLPNSQVGRQESNLSTVGVFGCCAVAKIAEAIRAIARTAKVRVMAKFLSGVAS